MATIQIKNVETEASQLNDTDKIPLSQGDNVARVVTPAKIHEYVKGKADNAPTEGSSNLVTSGGVKDALDGKADQSELTNLSQDIDNFGGAFSISTGENLALSYNMPGTGFHTFGNFSLLAGSYKVSASCGTLVPEYPLYVQLWDENGQIGSTGLTVDEPSKAFHPELSEMKNGCYIRVYCGMVCTGISVTIENIQSLARVKRVATEGFSLGPFEGHPYYYHFNPNGNGGFTKDKDGNNVVPSQSLFDIALAKRLGFKQIEVNVQETQDHVYICLHSAGNNKFGTFVKSADTSVYSDATVQGWKIGDHTYAEISQYVRYNSHYAKYQTKIPTLEEFLAECKVQEITPFVEVVGKDELVQLVKMYFGNKFMLYRPPNNVRDDFDGIVYTFSSDSSVSVANRIETADVYGAPYVCGLSPDVISAMITAGTFDDLVEQMHAKGYMIGTAYSYNTLDNELMRLGVDVFAADSQVNNFEEWNYECFDIDDAANLPSSTGTISAGKIVLAIGETVTCGSANVIALGKGMLSIMFNGTISISFGARGSSYRTSIQSDGSKILVFTDYYNLRSTELTITAVAATEITYFVYKTSKC